MSKIIEFPNNFNNKKIENKLITCKEKDFYEAYEMTAKYCQSIIANGYKDPCGYQFYLHEENIFPSLDIDTDRNHYRLNCICPNCGYILTLNKKYLPDHIVHKYDHLGATEVMEIFNENINKSKSPKR